MKTVKARSTDNDNRLQAATAAFKSSLENSPLAMLQPLSASREGTLDKFFATMGDIHRSFENEKNQVSEKLGTRHIISASEKARIHANFVTSQQNVLSRAMDALTECCTTIVDNDLEVKGGWHGLREAIEFSGRMISNQSNRITLSMLSKLGDSVNRKVQYYIRDLKNESYLSNEELVKITQENISLEKKNGIETSTRQLVSSCVGDLSEDQEKYLMQLREHSLSLNHEYQKVKIAGRTMFQLFQDSDKKFRESEAMWHRKEADLTSRINRLSESISKTSAMMQQMREEKERLYSENSSLRGRYEKLLRESEQKSAHQATRVGQLEAEISGLSRTRKTVSSSMNTMVDEVNARTRRIKELESLLGTEQRERRLLVADLEEHKIKIKNLQDEMTYIQQENQAKIRDLEMDRREHIADWQQHETDIESFDRLKKKSAALEDQIRVISSRFACVVCNDDEGVLFRGFRVDSRGHVMCSECFNTTSRLDSHTWPCPLRCGADFMSTFEILIDCKVDLEPLQQDLEYQSFVKSLVTSATGEVSVKGS